MTKINYIKLNSSKGLYNIYRALMFNEQCYQGTSDLRISFFKYEFSFFGADFQENITFFDKGECARRNIKVNNIAIKYYDNIKTSYFTYLLRNVGL